VNDTLYLLVQYTAGGREETADEIAILDAVLAVLAVPGMLHVVPVRVPHLLREG